VTITSLAIPTSWLLTLTYWSSKSCRLRQRTGPISTAFCKDGDQVNFNSPHDLYLTETELGDNYAQDHLSAKEHGGGAFIEYHDNEHWHYPMDETSGGYYIVGKTYRGRDGSGKSSKSRGFGDQYHIEVAAMKIPYGFGVLSHPWVWHCDAFLTGKWRMAYGDTENYTTLKLYDDIANPTRIHINPLEDQSNKADDAGGYGYDENNNNNDPYAEFYN